MEKEYDTEREKHLLGPDSLLTEDSWTLKINPKNFRLYLDDENNDGFKKLRKLYWTDYHCSHTIFGKYSLVFNDSELTIYADSNSDLLEFIKTYNLKIISEVEYALVDIDIKIKELEAAKEIITNLLKEI